MNSILTNKVFSSEKIWNAINLGLILIDGEGRVVLWNDWMVKHSGIPADFALDKSLESLFPGSLTDTFKMTIKNALSHKLQIVLSGALHRSPLPLYPLPIRQHEQNRMQQSITIKPVILGEGGRLCLIQVADAGVSIKRELVPKSQLERLTLESTTDGLTGAGNRRFFDERLRAEFGRAQRQNSPISLVMMDLDFFKRYNDLYGYPAGDKVLISVANALKSELLRPTDMMARYGGEEFVVILPDSGPEGRLVVAKRLLAAISDLNIPHGGSKVADHVTVSIGVATHLPGTACNEICLLEAADMALYNAKHSGRNCVRLSSLHNCLSPLCPSGHAGLE